jgi:hypothetical protein
LIRRIALEFIDSNIAGHGDASHRRRNRTTARLCCTKVQLTLGSRDRPSPRQRKRPVCRARCSRREENVFAFAGEPKGRYASAEWHKFNGKAYQKMATAVLLNPIAPVDIEVTNDGMLITFDNWHNRRYRLGRGALQARRHDIQKIHAAGSLLQE